MALCRNDLRAIAASAFLLASCSAFIEPSDPSPGIPLSHLSLKAGFGPELLLGDVHLVPGDSLILKATVEGYPADYGVPSITATDTAALQSRNDGTAVVRRPGEVNLTVVALPKVVSARTPVLSANARLHVACTADMRAGVNLTFLDSMSGAPVATLSTRRIRATSASRVDSIVVSPSGALILGGVWLTGEGRWAFAMESPGTWSVDVEADGYRVWRGDGIVVSRGICHVIAVNVTARLAPR
jgi:hypothetical protein